MSTRNEHGVAVLDAPRNEERRMMQRQAQRSQPRQDEARARWGTIAPSPVGTPWSSRSSSGRRWSSGGSRPVHPVALPAHRSGPVHPLSLIEGRVA